MGKLKALAGQTAVYGLSTMLGRLLNYLLVALHTRIFMPEEFGVITELYAYATFLLILLTYGMETAYFRYCEKEDNKEIVYSTSLFSIFITSALFIIAMFVFAEKIAVLLNYPHNSNYIKYFAVIMAADALTAIPFARLRQLKKAFQFAMIRLAGIIVYILLNVLLLIAIPYLSQKFPDSFLGRFYSAEMGVSYVFIANLVSSVFMLSLLLPTVLKINFKVDIKLLLKMLKYALPLLLAGLAGMVNETIDRILLKQLLPSGKNVMEQIGIYGANYKLAVLMTLFIQMFRYAAEPFFFSHSKDSDAKKLYADVMKYFVIFCLLIFLGVTLYIDITKYFIGEKFHEGLKIVPIALLSNLFLGVLVNLSIWYKLENLTRYGAYIAIFGAILTIVSNIILIPLESEYFGGYMGAAWAALISHTAMMFLSYFLGRKYYKIDYDNKALILYFVIALGIYLVSTIIKTESLIINIFSGTILISGFISFIIFRENLYRQIASRLHIGQKK